MQSTIEADRIASSLRSYEITDDAAVALFLAEHADLGSILREAPARIASAFRPPHHLRLQVAHDREAPGLSELHLVIVTWMATEAEWDAAEAGVLRLYGDWLKYLPREHTRDLLVRAEPR